MASNVYGLRLLARPRVRRLALGLVVALVLAVRLLQFVGWVGGPDWGHDLSAYWAAAARLLAGQPLYSAFQLAGPYPLGANFLYVYPPPPAAMLAPLALLFPADYRAAEWVWTVMGSLIVVGAVLTLVRTERLDERFPLLAGAGRWWLVGAAFAFPPVVGELVLGNVNALLLGLATVAWLGVRRADGAGDVLAGVAIGVATVVKVFPAVLILWLLLTRRYRAAAWSMAAAVTLTLATLPLTGLVPWLQFPAVLANITSPTDLTYTAAPTVWLGLLIGFTPARLVVTAVGLALVAWSARVPSTRLGFAIVVVVMVLITPSVYQHYLAIFVLPLLLGLAAGVRLRWLALAYLLMWGGQQPAFGDLSWVVNRAFPTLGALVLLAVLARSAVAGPRPAQGSMAVSAAKVA